MHDKQWSDSPWLVEACQWVYKDNLFVTLVFDIFAKIPDQSQLCFHKYGHLHSKNRINIGGCIHHSVWISYNPPSSHNMSDNMQPLSSWFGFKAVKWEIHK